MAVAFAILHSARTRARQRGFTMIELIVIIVIIALFAGSVIPAYQRFYTGKQFEAEVETIRGLFAEAREQAVSRDTDVIVRFDPTIQTFIMDITPPSFTADRPVALMGENTDLTVEGVRGWTMTQPIYSATMTVLNSSGSEGRQQAQGASLRFRSDGTCDGGLVLVRREEDGYVARLMILPATGQIVREDDSR